MSDVMVFVPAAPATWRGTLSGNNAGSAKVWGHAATPELRRALDLIDDEQAEHAAMLLASVSALAQHGTRFVLGCQVSSNDVHVEPSQPDTDNGLVWLNPIDPDRVVSWFTDAADVDVAAAAAAAAGHSIDEAWELPEVSSLIAEHGLLWHAAEELPAPEPQAPAQPAPHEGD